ncbi:hypothetical protein Dsin_009273 [Dipteronia sinensis]|uniref:glutamate decarboxylase n=1 Tax=Dipteronia sinensis TaxID=43782 RepID=A0AAE0EBH0_9ROSI|nr:hypothetical protein Dsin_009273 [Dipteronia sinensis]
MAGFAALMDWLCMDEYHVTTELQNRCLNLIGHLFNPPLEELEDASELESLGDYSALSATKFKEVCYTPTEEDIINDIIRKNYDGVVEIEDDDGVSHEISKVSTSNTIEMLNLIETFLLQQEELVDENTTCVAAILGSTLNAEFEDVKLLNDLLLEKNKQTGWDTPIYVDAASGGFIEPFLYPELEWDIRLPLLDQSVSRLFA